MDHMKKLKDKKGMHKMHPMEQKAKMGVMEDLQKMAEHAMGGKLKGMKKVTVASDSTEGLEHGLDKAHDVLGHMPAALDDSNPDHHDFASAHDSDDGNDGMGHESDDAAQRLAMGGEVGDEDHMNDDEESEAHELPGYDDMDHSEMSAHLEALVRAMKSKGLA